MILSQKGRVRAFHEPCSPDTFAFSINILYRHSISRFPERALNSLAQFLKTLPRAVEVGFMSAEVR